MREGFTAFNPIGALEAMAQQRTDEANGAKLRVDDLLPSSPEAALEAGLTEIDLLKQQNIIVRHEAVRLMG